MNDNKGDNESKKRKVIHQYWLRKLSGDLSAVTLPVFNDKRDQQGKTPLQVRVEIPPWGYANVKKITGDSARGIFVLFLSALTFLLNKYTGNEEIIIGTITPTNPGTQEQPGEILLLRNFISGDLTLKQVIQRNKENVLEAFKYGDYSFERLYEKLLEKRKANCLDIFNIAVIHSKFQRKSQSLHRFDLVFVLSEKNRQTLLQVEYNSAIYMPEMIQGFCRNLVHVFIHMPGNLEKKIPGIDMMTGEEKRLLLETFNATRREYPRDRTLHQLFQEQQEKTPHHIVLIFEDIQMTYGVLEGKTNAFARQLQKKGVTPGSIVGIMMETSIRMLAAVMATLKAGGVYLPLSPAYPVKRIEYTLKDSRTKILLKGEESGQLQGLPCEIMDLTQHPGNNPEKQDQREKQHQGKSPGPGDLAYIFYTSGSTGTPKGVQIQHNSIVNQLYGLKKMYAFDSSFNHILLNPFTFDPSMQQIFLPMISGGKLFLVTQFIKSDMRQLLKFFNDRSIDIVNTVPSIMKVLLDYVDLSHPLSCRYIILAGEIFTGDLYLRLKEKARAGKIINIYGPTEATINTTLYECCRRENRSFIPIGKPLMNYRVFILDENLKPVPVGVVGELCISGVGLARGYLNSPELTAEKFKRAVIRHSSFVISSSSKLTNDQCPVTNDRSYKLYFTADLARWLPDGNIQFIGRIDLQVKVRGSRIDLGEIESQILTYEGIKETVVLVKKHEHGDEFLCAYIIPGRKAQGAGHADFDVSKLREYLAARLPHYMVPSYFVFPGSIPLTPNGKVDRKSLPEPAMETGQSYIGPGNELEKKLAAIWSELLSLDKEKISMDANFFQLGGHSLKATVMSARVHKEFHVKLPISEIFKTPNIKDLSGYIQDRKKNADTPIEPTEKKEYYFLSPAQKRLYIQRQMDLHSTAYNMSQFIFLTNEIQREKLRKIFKRLIKRHESLRTSFHMIDDQPVQKVHDETAFEVEFYDLDRIRVEVEAEQSSHFEGTRGLAPLPGDPLSEESHLSSSDIIRRLMSDFIRPFTFSRVPLLRVGLIKTMESDSLLMVDMHHIISDGISHEILETEFKQLYKGQELPGLRLQYKDFSHWQNRQANSSFMKNRESYWLKQFAGGIPTLNLPTDYPRCEVKDLKGSAINFEISTEAAVLLRKMIADEGTTLFITIFAVFNVFLAKLSGQEDIIVGTPTAGRNHADLQPIIGMFVNTLALRNRPQTGKAFIQFLREIKTRVLEAFENQDYPLEELVEKVVKKREPNRSPLFDVMFQLRIIDLQYDGEPGNETSAEKPALLANEPGESINIDRTSKYDLTFDGVEEGEKISFSVEYNIRLFKKETIEDYVQYFEQILVEVLKKPGILLKDIKLSHEFSKKRLDNPEITFDF